MLLACLAGPGLAQAQTYLHAGLSGKYWAGSDKPLVSAIDLRVGRQVLPTVQVGGRLDLAWMPPAPVGFAAGLDVFGRVTIGFIFNLYVEGAVGLWAQSTNREPPPQVLGVHLEVGAGIRLTIFNMGLVAGWLYSAPTLGLRVGIEI